MNRPRFTIFLLMLFGHRPTKAIDLLFKYTHTFFFRFLLIFDFTKMQLIVRLFGVNL